MSKKTRPVIDCTNEPAGDLLSGWSIAPIVHLSETANAILDDLGDEWSLEGADLDGKGYAIDLDNRVITLDTGGLTQAAIARSNHFLSTLALRCFAGLRAAWQADRADDARAMHRPDLWLLLGRILDADTASMAIRMAYEARNEGDETIWRHVLGEENGDMALGYARMEDTRSFAKDDSVALAGMFAQWFSKENRLSTADAETLSYMDDVLPNLSMSGRGQLAEGAIRCLTIDPVSGASYLGVFAGELAGDPAWSNIANPLTEAHFLQIMQEIGVVRQGAVAVRDKKLAARLFADTLLTV